MAPKNWSARVADGLKERYDIERVLGRGGMAVVWLARDRKLKRPVAIKVLDPSVSARIGAERFVREVRITAPLQHPNILPLLDSGTVDGIVYSVMPFVEGESLRDRLDHESPLPVEEALLFAREIAEALDYAHQRGIVHRDVKPENILISNGAAVIADFGIARATSLPGDPNLTSAGVPLGTPAYMSPEQASGRAEVDGRSDVYALGCTLYEMLAGHLPFTGTTEDVIRRHREDEPPSLLEARPELAPHVAELVMRALAKRPEERFTSAEMALELRTALGEPVRQPTPADRRTPRPRTLTPPVVRSRPWPTHAGGWLILVSLLAAVLAAVAHFTHAGHPRKVAPVRPDSAPAPAPSALAPILSAPPDSAHAPAASGDALTRFDLRTPATEARLPPELREASGVEVLPDGRVLVHGDELGVVYTVDPVSGRAEPFAEARGSQRAGDYEDLALAADRLFLVASDGALLEWNVTRPTDAPTAYPAELGRKCDVESLAFVPPRDALLLLCKHHRMPGATGGVLGFWWSLQSRRLDVQQPFRIDAAQLDSTRQFSASGATWDSVSSHLLMVAGPDHRIAEVNLDGKVVATADLDSTRHPQAEGIALTHAGRLVITDEGRRTGARITTYAATPQ